MHLRRAAVTVVSFLLVFVWDAARAIPAGAGGGTLDTSFGGDGTVMTNFTSGLDFAFASAVAADSKIIVAGGVGGGGGRFGLARYQSDGVLDDSFGGDGKVITNFTSGFDAAYDVAIQAADGKIIVAGEVRGGGGRFGLARYETDGTLDVTFGGDGKVTTNFGPGDDYAFSVAIQADGKVVAAGEAAGGGGKFALARYETDGALDATFGGDGMVTTNFTSHYDVVDTIAVQPADGKLVLLGTSNYYGPHPRLALARYKTDGKLDPTFGGDGKETDRFKDNDTWGFAVAIQPSDGKIVAGGQSGGGNAGRFGVARYNTDGTRDVSFNGDGIVLTNFTDGLDYIDELVVQAADEKIVAGGAADFFGADSRFALARYDVHGKLDATFSGDGMITTDFPGAASAFGVALQPTDGKIVAVGRAGGSGGRFALARYLAS